MTAASLGKMPTTSAAPLDFAVQSLQRIGGVDLGAVLRGEVHVGEHVGLGLVQQAGEFGHARPHLVGDLAPLLACGFGVVLGKGGADPGGDDAALGLAGIAPGRCA